MFISIPPQAVICHYAQVGNGWAVITANRTILAPSFYDLRHRYTFHCSINGAGGWVVLLPIPQPIQAQLF